MFCEERITAVYEGLKEKRSKNVNSFLDCYHDLAYHMTEGFRVILETENHFISIRANGVTIDKKQCPIEEFGEPDELIAPFYDKTVTPPWEDYESTLFVGERLLNVEKIGPHHILQFDHFTLKVIPHETEEEDFPSLFTDHSVYFHVYGCERLITKKCSCGGTGELLLDFVDDYLVRCKECKKSTRASMNAIDAIDDWNKGELYCDCSDIVIE